MGHRKAIACILWRRKFAHVRILHQEPQTAVGQLEFIGDICAFNPWFPAALPVQAHARASCGSPLRSGWANARSLPEYYGSGSGPMRGLPVRDFRLLWANSSSSATSTQFIHGPIRQYVLAALLLQAHARVSRGSPLHSGWACCGPVQAHRQAGMHLGCRPMRALWLAVDFLLAAKIMGQFDIMVEII